MSYCIGGNGGCDGVVIGSLPTQAHDVSGVLYVEDEYTFCIENFNYDGQGPGTNFSLSCLAS